jgi:hypothetical protein
MVAVPPLMKPCEMPKLAVWALLTSEVVPVVMVLF